MEYKLNSQDPGGRFAIVASCYYDDIIDGLITGSLKTFAAAGVNEDRIDLVRVPGALELPLIAKKLAESKKYESILALGAVIRGDSSHYDIVINESCHHLAAITVDTGVPILNAVLTVYKRSDAEDRSKDDDKNKGAEAARAALQMSNLIKKL